MALTHDPDSAAMRALGHTHLVLDALPRAVVVADLEGTILAANAVARRVYGLAAREPVGRSIKEFFSSASALDVANVIGLVRSGQTWTGAVPAAQPDGTTDWVYAWVAPLKDEAGEVVGFIGAADDAQSELRVLEQRASDLSEHLVLALAAGELGTWHWNLASGVTEWDSTMERIFGLEPGTFDGTFEHWVSLIHPDDVDETVATLERAVTNKSAYEVEHRVIWGDGTVHWLQGRGTVTLDSDGNVTGTIGCTSDITPRKRLELEATRQVRAGRRRGATGALCCASDSSSSRRSTGSQSPPGTIAS